ARYACSGTSHLVASLLAFVFFSQAEDGIRAATVTGVQTCALPISVEEDITRAVAAAIGGRLQPAERATLAVGPTASPEAYDHFLRGNHFLLARTGGSIARAIEQYEAATRVDPRFADAFARMAFGYGLFLEWSCPSPITPRDSPLARAVAAADRALALRPASSDAWVARGQLLSVPDLSYRS